MSVYILVRKDAPNAPMVASDIGAARAMCAMFGPAWKAHKATATEVADPWIQGEIQAMKEAGIWPTNNEGEA